jgi:hypothetical protein
MKCESCGATVRKGDGRFCSHCGSKLPDVPRITPSEWVSHPERFAEAEASDRYSKAMIAPAPSVPKGGIVALALFLVIWVVFGVLMVKAAARFGGKLESLAPLAILSVGGLGILSQLYKVFKFSRSTVERRMIVVLDERTKVSGGGENSSASTSYFATIADRDGNRSEVATTGDVAGQIVDGDLGVGIFRGEYLVAFQRLDV